MATTKSKGPTKAQVARYLTELLDENMTLGNRAAITRTIQVVNGERKLK